MISYNNIQNLYLLNINFFNKNYKIIEIIFNISENEILNDLLWHRRLGHIGSKVLKQLGLIKKPR